MSPPNILITGATGGFGRATARLFAARGYFVGLVDLDEDRLAGLAEELGGSERAYFRALDVTDETGARELAAEFAAAAGGGIQVLFNNAGISAVGDFTAVDIGTQRRVLEVNLFGVFNVTHACLPYMRNTSGAHVITVSSASAIHGNPELVAYAATKRALLSFSESLDISLRGTGVAVSDLLPMYAKTAIVEDVAHLHRKRPDIRLTAEDIADEVWDIVRTRRFRSYVGADTKVFARLAKLLPYRLVKYVTRRVVGW